MHEIGCRARAAVRPFGSQCALSQTRDVGRNHSRPQAAVVIEPGLRRRSLQNGNIRGCGRRLSPIGALRWRFGSLETKSNARKAGISGPFSRFLGSLAERRNGWLGREDSNLRMVESKSTALPLGDAPTDCPEKRGRLRLLRIPLRQRRSIEGVEPFQQAGAGNSSRTRACHFMLQTALQAKCSRFRRNCPARRSLARFQPPES